MIETAPAVTKTADPAGQKARPPHDGKEVGWFLYGIADEGEKPRRIPISVPQFRVGRRPDLHLVLSSPSVSRLHAAVVSVADGLFLRDLGSSNGTFLNGERLQHDASIGEGDVIHFADVAFRVGSQKVPEITHTVQGISFEEITAASKIEQLLSGEQLHPFLQPIVPLQDDAPQHYEALARSSVPGLETPREMFLASERLNLEVQLSTVLRRRALEVSRGVVSNAAVFLNTHPAEDLLTEVLPSLHELRRIHPERPVVVEIHESSAANQAALEGFRDGLRELSIGLAFDDFGAGRSRLQELLKVAPEYVKFDMALVRDLHSATPAQQNMVGLLVQMINDMKITTVAEGIECQEDLDVCRQMGFRFAQGFHLGRPAPAETFWERN